MKKLFFVVVPLAFVIATSTVPAEWAGTVTLMRVSLCTLRPTTLVPPKVTDEEPATVVKFLPVIDTETAPLVGPEVRDMLVTIGRSWLYV